MISKTCVIDNASKTKKMAAAIEAKANKMAQAGWEFVRFSMTSSAKAILVFRMPAAILLEKTAPDHAAPAEAVPEDASVAAAAEIAGWAE